MIPLCLEQDIGNFFPYCFFIYSSRILALKKPRELLKGSYLQKRGWKWPRGMCDSNLNQALHVLSSRNLSLEHRYIKVENLSGCRLLKGTAYSLLLPRLPLFLFFEGPDRSNSLNSVSFPISFQCGLLKVSFYCWQPENPAWSKTPWNM